MWSPRWNMAQHEGRVTAMMLPSPVWLQGPILGCFMDALTWVLSGDVLGMWWPASSSLIGKVGIDESLPAEERAWAKREKRAYDALWVTSSWNLQRMGFSRRWWCESSMNHGSLWILRMFFVLRIWSLTACIRASWEACLQCTCLSHSPVLRIHK